MSADELAARYLAVRAATEALAAPLSAEDQQLQSMPSCSPTKWHRAHTTWFFEEFVLGPRGVPPLDPRSRFLWNSYYEAVGARHPRPQRGLLSRPSLDEVAEYRRATDGRVVELLAGLDERALAELEPVLELGLAHEEQHQELLLTDILHAFAQSPLRPAVRPPELRPVIARRAALPLSFRRFEGGVVELGAPDDGTFAFDNERPRHRVFLEPFELASRPVTVGEVRAFIAARGYETPSLWLSEGWDHVRARGAAAPALLRLEGDRAIVFDLDGEREADDDEPAAHLDFYEADAIARFLGGRLPTEAEWELASRAHDPRAGNFWERDLAGGALRPLAGSESFFGDVWEWTSSAYAPYPGFEAGPGAIGEYNGKFMVSQLVLRGGSCFTPRGHVRSTYRNFWHPPTSFQRTGARVARSLGAPGAR
jgi:ergothioneine biosynthesis protein EgtB